MSVIKVKFLKPIIKAGKLRKPGEVMELPLQTAINLAARKTVEIPGKEVVKVKVEVDVYKLVDKSPQKEGPKK